MTAESASPNEQSSASVASTDLPPNGPPLLTDADKVNQWLRQRYLEHGLEDGTEAAITMAEFLNIIRTEYPECYMPEQTVTLALALSVKKWGRSNTVVISDLHAQRLYALGAGIYTRQDVLDICPTLQQTLLESQKRWIIIPCNDGVLGTEHFGRSLEEHDKLSDEASATSSTTSAPNSVLGEQQCSESQDVVHKHQGSAAAAQQKDQSNNPEAESEKTPNKPDGPEQHGSHWGLLIIDKTEKVARWVDSAISLVESPDKPNKWKFEHMHPAARAAGKILCGFDTLLGQDNGFPQGGFTTSTLKYNPNQLEHNFSLGDEGPCGPFMFAFLEYIFERATTLDRAGVRKMFPRRRKGHVQFSSVEARQEIQRLIQQEGEKPGSMPFGLPLELLRTLNVLPVEQLQRATDVYLVKAVAPVRPVDNRPAANGLTRPSQSLLSDPVFLEASKQAKLADPGTYKDLPDSEALLLFYTMQQSALNAQGDKHTGSEGSKERKLNGQKSYTTEFYLGRDRYHNVPLQDTSIWPAPEIDIDFPTGFKKLPDFTDILPQTLKRWVNMNTEIKKQINTKSNGWEPTACAFLHVKFYKTFLGESDNNFNRLWSKDRAVFNSQDAEVKEILRIKNTEIRFGMMRLRIMRHYQGAEAVDTLLRILEKYKDKALAKSKNDNKSKDDKDDKDDPSSSDSEHDQDKPDGKDNPIGSGGDGAPDACPDNGDLFNSEDQNGPELSGNGGTADNHTALQDSAAFQAIANQAIDFAPMDEKHVNQWSIKTLSHSFLNSESSLWERKVHLQRAFGGFGTDITSKETAADYRTQLDMDGTWGLMQIIDALNERTNHVPDLRGQIQWYPDYYLQEHGVIPAEVNSQGADNQNNPPSDGFGSPSSASSNNAGLSNNVNTGNEDDTGAEKNARIDDSSGAETNNRASAGGGTNTGLDNTTGRGTGAQTKTNAGANTNPGRVTNAGINDNLGHGSNSSDGIHSLGLTTPMPQGLWEFRTLNKIELIKHVTIEMRKDPRVVNIWHRDEEALPDAVSWRAMCFVDISKGRFESENDADCMKIWHHDPLVFNEIQRRMNNYEPRMIKEMMANHYYRENWAKNDQGKKAREVLDPTQNVDFVDISNRLSDDDHDEEKQEGSTGESSISPDPPADSLQAPTDAFNTSGAKRKHKGGEDSLTKRRRQLTSGTQQQRGRQAVRDASSTLRSAAEHLGNTNFLAGFGSSESASSGRAAAGAPEGGDGDDPPQSSPLSTPPDSPVNPESPTEEETSSSDESDSDPHNGAASSNNNKRRRKSKDDNPEGEGGPLKKAKTGDAQGQSVNTPETEATNDHDDADGQTVNEELASDNPANTSFDSQPTVEDATVEVYIGRQTYILDPNDSSIFLTEDISTASWPPSVTSLPDFAHLLAPALLLWRRANLDLNFPAEFLKIGSYSTTLALLQIKFKRTFLHEPDENFSDVWINDGRVFSDTLRAELRAIADPWIRNGEIRRRMMQAYEPGMLQKIEAMPKPRPANPKITIQKGTFEDPESFESDVHVSRKGVPKRKESVDESRLAPGATRAPVGKARYWLRENRKPSMEKCEE